MLCRYPVPCRCVLSLLSQLLSSQTAVSGVTQPHTSAAALDNVAAPAVAPEESKRDNKHASVDSSADTTDSAGSSASRQQRQQQQQQPDVSAASSSSQLARPSVSERAAAARHASVPASHSVASSVASVYLPSVFINDAASSDSESTSAPLSCVDRLLSRIDFRAVTAGGTEFSLSAAQPSAAATELFAHFRQQARAASHWRAQQSAQLTVERNGEGRQSGGDGRKHTSGGREVGVEGEEEKQQLTSWLHGSLAREQLVTPVVSKAAERSQKDLSGARRRAVKLR